MVKRNKEKAYVKRYESCVIKILNFEKTAIPLYSNPIQLNQLYASITSVRSKFMVHHWSMSGLEMENDFAFIGIIEILVGNIISYNPTLDLSRCLSHQMEFHSHKRI